MLEKVISQNTDNCLEALKKGGLVDNFYLAGGTALAMQLLHRASLDLDFFSQEKINTKSLLLRLKELGGFSLEKEDWQTIHGILKNTKISFFYYPYPLLYRLKKLNGLAVADIRDIVCMKIDAISGRGSKKDFIDLYFICKQYSLAYLLKLYKKKYREIEVNMTHILKSLCYFQDAKNSPMPLMLSDCSWQTVEKFFQEEIKKIFKKQL